MKDSTLKILEYDKIIAMLSSFTSTEKGREMAVSLVPYQEEHRIVAGRDATTEAASLITYKGALPIGSFKDIRPHLSRAKKGGSLSMKELLEVAKNIGVACDINSFMKDEDMPALPIIRDMTSLIVAFPALREEITRCIITEDEMADNASPKLKDIRRNIGKQNEAIRSKLSKIITSSENRKILQDTIVTLRGGRYVIPIKQEHRQKFPGMIHDQSKGGQTLFIEPQEVVELNNTLRELELAEEQEIARILSELSVEVGDHYDELLNNQHLITELDFIMAKGKLSHSMQGEPVEIGDVLKLVQARHPLLDKEKAVPIDVTLGEDYTSLIITGPNTGGKTVSLKTVGLLSLMAMSGLHVPAACTGSIPIYREIFADIGDEQSIEQSLSTFSSHMKNIVEIIDDASWDTLILLDELGAGTDPTEGAALAISILETLKSKGAKVMATTHYNELKKYALATPGVSNASMEFDVETLSPTYRLMMGVPGKSNAFEISTKLGLGSEIIERASELIEGKDMEFEDVIGSISEDRTRAEQDRRQASMLLAEARAKAEYIDAKESKLTDQRESILNKAREEAREIVREAKEESKALKKELQRELKNLRRGGSSGIEHKITENTTKLNDLEKRYQSKLVQQVNSAPVRAEDLKPGDRVKILSLNQNGEVLGKPDNKGDLQVQVGAMKINVNVSDLMVINEGKDRKQPAGTKGGSSSSVSMPRMSKAMYISTSIDVRGENLEDALMDVEKYIDDAYVAGLKTVTVIHGRGEGILKQGIRDMLKRSKQVSSAHAGKYNEGGEGVTIVTLKE